MHAAMAGYYEIRNTGTGRRHYRLPCLLENETPEEFRAVGHDRSHIVVINGMVKPNAALLTDREHKTNIRYLGADYLSRPPRQIAD
jgi:hypothetical protein